PSCPYPTLFRARAGPHSEFSHLPSSPTRRAAARPAAPHRVAPAAESTPPAACATRPVISGREGRAHGPPRESHRHPRCRRSPCRRRGARAPGAPRETGGTETRTLSPRSGARQDRVRLTLAQREDQAVGPIRDARVYDGPAPQDLVVPTVQVEEAARLQPEREVPLVVQVIPGLVLVGRAEIRQTPEIPD